MISLVLHAKENEYIEFHASQHTKRLYPFRDGHLLAFWQTMDEAKQGLATSPLIAPLMAMFDISFVPMEDVHRDLAGKQLAMIEMMGEPPHLPFNLVFEVTETEAKAMTTATATPGGESGSPGRAR